MDLRVPCLAFWKGLENHVQIWRGHHEQEDSRHGGKLSSQFFCMLDVLRVVSIITKVLEDTYIQANAADCSHFVSGQWRQQLANNLAVASFGAWGKHRGSGP